MSDLISRKQAIDIISSLWTDKDGFTNHKRVLFELRKMPTARDLESVIEQLGKLMNHAEELMNHVNDNSCNYPCEYNLADLEERRYKTLCEIIEIINSHMATMNEKMQLNIVVVNCDDKFVEYEYESPHAFLKALESSREDIPMLDDFVHTVDYTDIHKNENELRNAGISTVDDLRSAVVDLLDRGLSKIFTGAADTIEGLSAESVIEVCPHCENEIEMRWDINKCGYKAFCPVCGKRLMLCSECMNSGAGGCDYNSKDDSCRFNPVNSGCVKVIHSAGGESYV